MCKLVKVDGNAAGTVYAADIYDFLYFKSVDQMKNSPDFVCKDIIDKGKGGCKFFCVYGGKILPIRFRYVPSSVELID